MDAPGRKTIHDAIVRLSDGDLVAYIRRIDLRTKMAAGQAAYNQLPSVTIANSMISTPTYLQRVRAEYDHHDTAAAQIEEQGQVLHRTRNRRKTLKPSIAAAWLTASAHSDASGWSARNACHRLAAVVPTSFWVFILFTLCNTYLIKIIIY